MARIFRGIAHEKRGFRSLSLRGRSVGASCYCAKIFNQYLLKAALRTPSLPIYDQSRYKSDDKRIVLLSYRSYSHRWKY